MAKRDDFDRKTVDILARRAGSRCSNPNCRKLTSGPQTDPEKALNIGVAAHITAAAEGGPRFNKKLESQERKSIDNGIWLCQNCAKLIDNDQQRYSVDILREWKKISEQAALLDIERLPLANAETQNDDIALIRFFSQCFDRPAFQDTFHQEGSTEAFDKAIEDTITAINTGCLRSRDGQVLAQAKGKSFLSNIDWRNQMDVIVDLLRAIRSRYALAVRTGQIHLGYQHQDYQFYLIRDRNLAYWMDSSRSEVIQMFAKICEEAGIPPLLFPRRGFGDPAW